MKSIVEDDSDFFGFTLEVRNQIRAQETALTAEALGMLKEAAADSRPQFVALRAELLDILDDPSELVDQVRRHIRSQLPAYAAVDSVVRMKNNIAALRALRGTREYNDSFPATSALYADKAAQ